MGPIEADQRRHLSLDQWISVARIWDDFFVLKTHSDRMLSCVSAADSESIHTGHAMKMIFVSLRKLQ